MLYVKIGSEQFQVEDTTVTSDEGLRGLFEPTHPEVKNATARRASEGDDTIVEFLPQPGKKG